MHEIQRRRLEALEAASGLRQQAARHVISIVFDPLEPTYATGPDNFVCYRRADEDLADFEARAAQEVLASYQAEGSQWASNGILGLGGTESVSLLLRVRKCLRLSLEWPDRRAVREATGKAHQKNNLRLSKVPPRGNYPERRP